MKKSVIIFAFLALFSIALISAGLALESAEQQKGFKETTNAALEKEITIPAGLQGVARVLFGIQSDHPVNFQQLIILLATFVIFFLIIREVIAFVPFFEKGWISLLGAFIISMLTGAAGGFLFLTGEMLYIGSIFGLLKGWNILSLTIALVLLIVIIVLLSKVIEDTKRRARIERARISSTQAGAEIGLLRRRRVR